MPAPPNPTRITPPFTLPAPATHTPNCDRHGFLADLRDCTFHFGENQRELTIKAPEGCRIGLPWADGIKALTGEQAAEARAANGERGQF